MDILHPRTFKNKEPYKFLRITDIQDQSVNWTEVPYAKDLSDEKIANKYLLKNGDVVFARTGATTGKSYLVTGCEYPTVFASYLIRVSPIETIVDPKFLYFFFQSSNYWAQVENQRGAAQVGINATVLGQIEYSSNTY